MKISSYHWKVGTSLKYSPKNVSQELELSVYVLSANFITFGMLWVRISPHRNVRLVAATDGLFHSDMSGYL